MAPGFDHLLPYTAAPFLHTAIGRSIKSDKAVTAAFKAYDACSLPLLDLVEVLAGAADPAAFAKATFEEMVSVGVDTDQLSISELCLDWEALQDKLEATPELFQTTIWPALTAVGWQYAAQDTAAATSSDAGILPTAANEQQQQPTSPVTAAPAGSATITDGSQQQHFYVPPATVSAAYLASAGEPLQPCSSWQDVLTALQDAAQPVPPGLVSSLRQAELGEAQQACLQPPAADAPHRCVHDPSNKRPGTPLTSRKLMCANCGISYSTVWRIGNAGLTLCNACGMFYNKHDHEHRPEHLIASARAKAEAQAAAAAAGAAAGSSPLRQRGMASGSGMRGFTPDGGPTDGEMSDDGRRPGSSDSEEEECEGRRPRRRRRAQVSKWLAGDEYLVLDGPLRSSGGAPDPAWALQGSGGSYNAPTGYGYGSYDDARGCSDGQRGRNSASPCFGPSGGYARYRGSSQQQQRQYGGGYGRSRSMEAEGAGQARWQAQRGYHDFRDRASSMDWEDEEGGCGGEDEQEEAGPWGDDEEGCEGGWGGGWCDGGAGLLEERRLEDMESLLGRILLHRWGASWLALCGCRAGQGRA
eukprot:jgi/Sobl393_1/6391/SZX78464.1